MDRQIERGLEDYLHRLGSSRPEDADNVAEFRRLLEQTDEETRRLVRGMESSSRMLRALRAPEDAMPAPGFYARVMERVEQQRNSSIWSAFLDQQFSRRLAYASLLLLFLLSASIFWSDPPQAEIAMDPANAMVETHESHVGEDPEQDRNAVLVDLANYQSE